MMALSEFGKAIRKARIDAGQNISTMAEKLNVSAGYLSGLENGRKKISDEWVLKIKSFFSAYKIKLDNLDELAALSNKEVQIDGLSHQHQMLAVGFAKSKLSKKELDEFASLLEKIKNKKGSNNDN
jgi:transcriptional regulator with XRE-family HTH domain